MDGRSEEGDRSMDGSRKEETGVWMHGKGEEGRGVWMGGGRKGDEYGCMEGGRKGGREERKIMVGRKGKGRGLALEGGVKLL